MPSKPCSEMCTRLHGSEIRAVNFATRLNTTHAQTPFIAGFPLSSLLWGVSLSESHIQQVAEGLEELGFIILIIWETQSALPNVSRLIQEAYAQPLISSYSTATVT